MSTLPIGFFLQNCFDWRAEIIIVCVCLCKHSKQNIFENTKLLWICPTKKNLAALHEDTRLLHEDTRLLHEDTRLLLDRTHQNRDHKHHSGGSGVVLGICAVAALVLAVLAELKLRKLLKLCATT